MEDPVNAMLCHHGFHPSMLAWCSMHQLNLGIMQDFSGSAILLLVRISFFGNYNAEDHLRESMKECTRRFKDFCKLHSFECSQCWLTTGMLHDNQTGWPSLKLKAYNARIFLMFVRAALQAAKSAREAQGLEEDAELSYAVMAAKALCSWFALVERAGRYLTPEQAAEQETAGLVFLRCYTFLARLAASQSIRRWHVITKFHGFRHILQSARLTLYNSRFLHTYVDEDFVGVWIRLSRRVAHALFEFRVLCRFLLRLQAMRTVDQRSVPARWS
ncbi:unnamed protein product [Symbiodinium sp. CCMP2592]|nr:unnamed protein product [Symbiodinium sp. CCMP2592]